MINQCQRSLLVRGRVAFSGGGWGATHQSHVQESRENVHVERVVVHVRFRVRRLGSALAHTRWRQHQTVQSARRLRPLLQMDWVRHRDTYLYDKLPGLWLNRLYRTFQYFQKINEHSTIMTIVMDCLKLILPQKTNTKCSFNQLIILLCNKDITGDRHHKSTDWNDKIHIQIALNVWIWRIHEVNHWNKIKLISIEFYIQNTWKSSSCLKLWSVGSSLYWLVEPAGSS